MTVSFTIFSISYYSNLIYHGLVKSTTITVYCTVGNKELILACNSDVTINSNVLLLLYLEFKMVRL